MEKSISSLTFEINSQTFNADVYKFCHLYNSEVYRTSLTFTIQKSISSLTYNFSFYNYYGIPKN